MLTEWRQYREHDPVAFGEVVASRRVLDGRPDVIAWVRPAGYLPAMGRGDHWWSEPPWWAWITMVAGLVAVIVMLPIALNRTAPAVRDFGATPDSSIAPQRPAPGSAKPSEDVVNPLRIVVIGDGYARDADQGENAWPALLEQRIPDLEVEAVTTGDAGYVTSAGDPTLADLAAEADLADADVVVLFGSRFDASGISDRVSAAAREAIASVGSRAPQADLVVVGPLWPGGGPPAGVRNNRDVIRAAAEAAGVSIVDPLADGWLADDAGVVGDDGVHLTDEGQAALADLVQPVVEGALGNRAGTTTPGG